MPIAIIGAGGMARDALVVLDALGLAGQVRAFFETDDFWRSREVHGYPVLPLSRLDASSDEVVIALGNGRDREAMVQRLPGSTRYPVFVHPSAVVGRNVRFGEGTIVCAGSILTTDVAIGRHAQINVACSITHDCRLDDFVTLSPGVRLSGNCTLGRGVFVGTGACLREKSTIASGVIVGMGAVVVGSLTMPGTYLGCPARRRE